MTPSHHARHAKGLLATFGALLGLGHKDHPLAAHQFGQIFERVAGQIEADGRELFVQLFRRCPRVALGQARTGDGCVGEQADLGRGPIRTDALRVGD